MAMETAVDSLSGPMMGMRQRQNYNDAERWFSRVLQQRLDDVLEAQRDTLQVVRIYPAQPNRLGIMPTPADFPREKLRLSVVRELVFRTIDFVRSDEKGGPVSQSVAPDGTIYEVQAFTTKYPHIVIERTDRFVGDEVAPVEITWSLRRVQNQRRQTELNRIIDAAGLFVDVIRLFV